MGIREKGYERWEGSLKEQRRPWWPITRLGIKLAFRKKNFKFLFAGAFLPAFVFLAGVYISERIEDFQNMFRSSSPQKFFEVNPAFFRTYFSNDALLFLMIMIMVFAGAGLIADDLKFNSLQIYFSRPIRKKDYVLGKCAVLLFFLLLLTIVPGLLFIIFKMIFAGSFGLIRDYPWLPLSILGYSVFLSAFITLYTLLLSSLNRNRRYVSILIFAIYIFSDVLYGIFYSRFRDQYFSLLSIKSNIQQAAAFFFRVRPPFRVPVAYSFIILIAIGLVSIAVMRKKIRSVDVIK
jgi:ABC-2 type transport system permease protein